MIFGDVVASAATTGSSRRAANIRLRTMITHRHRVGFWLLCLFVKLLAVCHGFLQLAGKERRRKDAWSTAGKSKLPRNRLMM